MSNAWRQIRRTRGQRKSWSMSADCELKQDRDEYRSFATSGGGYATVLIGMQRDRKSH
jgi:hypothetical protein